MIKVLSTVQRQRFEKFNVDFPQNWEINYLDPAYTDAELIEACKDADFLFIMSTHTVSTRVIRACPRLKLIHVEGVGFDKVDIQAAKELGIPVCNNRAVNDGAVAEHTIGLMLAGLRRTASSDAQIKAIGYPACQQEFMAAGQRELQSTHVGLIGMGAIGREVARRLKNWNCSISYYDAFRPAPGIEKELGVEYLELQELLQRCDIISLHVPVLPSTYHMLSTKEFEMMKPSALVVNTARGEIIDPMALADALENGKIYGAALDTLYPEPAPVYHPLLNLSPQGRKRLTLTPHVGGTTDEAFTRMLKGAIANMHRVLDGIQPIHVVNGVEIQRESAVSNG